MSLLISLLRTMLIPVVKINNENNNKNIVHNKSKSNNIYMRY